MNGLKNFFYKNNDIIIVALILIVAASLIFNRVSIIMEYPEKMASQNLTESAQDADTEDVEEGTE